MEGVFDNGIGWVLVGLLFVSVGAWAMSKNAITGSLAIAFGVLAFYVAKQELGK